MKRSLRKELGLTQEIFAAMIGTSRSNLAMVERTHRHLPWKAGSTESRISNKAWPVVLPLELTTEEQERVEMQRAEILADYERTQRSVQLDIRRTEKKLEKMKADHEAACRALALGHQLLASQDTDDMVSASLKLQARIVMKKYLKTHPHRQLMLEIKLRSFEQKLSEVRGALSSLG